MLPHCGKCKNATGMVQMTAVAPINERPVAVENLELEKNTSCVKPEPKFPPAPVRPDMSPSDRRETNGTTPKVAPHAAWVPSEKRIIAKMAMGSESARPSQIQKAPPRVWKNQRIHSLPLIPNNLAALSEA
ncbi:hypothetical protein J1N35_008766 [Gossypium stocksii]|uniref:Uncharacterized protein n=1 Tax=Gossypium stocksii TaxID=47602 RepID=A0A9D3W9X6_9ROSI|nr:hypothetical protein J1N35_008766 [Gossypium stocksii]